MEEFMFININMNFRFYIDKCINIRDKCISRILL